jgi:hypothetical protein
MLMHVIREQIGVVFCNLQSVQGGRYTKKIKE